MASSQDSQSVGTSQAERHPSLGSRVKGFLPHLVAAAVSGALVYVSFPPFDYGGLAFVAFVPLLVALDRARSYRTAIVSGWLSGMIACTGCFAWVASVAGPGWLVLSAYVALYFGAAALLIRWMQRHMRTLWPLTAALAWVALELVRARLGPGFPWLFVGYTQYRASGLLQVAAFGGVYAVGAVVFLTNTSMAAAVSAVLPGGRKIGPGRLWWTVPASAAVLATACVGGDALRGRVELRDGPVVGVVQQNIPRVLAEIYDPAKTAEDYYRERGDEVQLCAQLTARMRGRGVRLVAWPESTVSVPLDLPPAVFAVDEERKLYLQAINYLRDLGQDMGCYFLVGAPSYVSREAARSLLYGIHATPEFSSSADFVSPEGRVVDRYDKMRLVPFGEYIPWRHELPFLAAFTPIPRELTPGREPVIFHLPDGTETRFGALVCYEDVFPDVCVDFRRRGAQFLVNVTEEGWYLIDGELRQHVAMAVFRAVETRTTVVRAANTGISCFIDPRGDVYAALEPWTQGVLSAPVRLSDDRTPYVRFGDAFAVVCLMLTVALPGIVPALRRP
jgi:apolipoprotein N-acyltransferase